MHWHGNGNGLGQGEVERVQLEDKHEVKDVSFKRCPRGEASQSKARQGEVASGMRRGQAQAMEKGKESQAG